MNTAKKRSPMSSVRDVAERLDVCERTIRRLIERGELGAHRVGRLVRVSDDAVERYLARTRS